MSHCPSGDELAQRSQDRISPRHRAGDAGLGMQTSPIHKRNEPDSAQLLQALRRHLNLAAMRSGAEATTPPQAQDVSLLPAPAPRTGCKGVSRCASPQNQHCQGPGAAQLIPCPPGAPSPGMLEGSGGTTRGTGGDEGRATPPSRGCQHLVPARRGRGRAQAGRGPGLPPKKLLLLAGRAHAGRPLPAPGPGGRMGAALVSPPPHPPSCPGEGLALPGCPGTHPGNPLLPGTPFPTPQRSLEGTGWGGHPRGLPTAPPTQQKWETAPMGDCLAQAPSPLMGTRRPSPAEKANSSHQWQRGGHPRE